MAKFRGAIGFATNVEKEPGIHVEEIVEKIYSGELRRNNRRLDSATSVNDNINISNEISIIADPYLNRHFHTMRYVEFSGAKWKVSSVDATQRPRLILTLGGLYNG